MTFRALLAAIAGIAISVVIVVKVMGMKGPPVADNPNMVMTQPVLKSPVPLKSGPQPEVLVSEFEWQFGSMALGETRSHDFIFTNRGKGPLTIKMGETTCQCTYGDLKAGEQRVIPPGSSETIKLTWKPTGATDYFSKGAEILTDDPKQPSINLRVTGKVAEQVTVFPGIEWECPEIFESKSVVCRGGLLSTILDSFNVTSVEARGKPLKFEVLPMTPEQLDDSRKSKSGYEIRVTIPPDMDMGAFRFPVHIKTDVPSITEAEGDSGKFVEFDVTVMGVRKGPITFAGPHWLDEKMAVSLGQFELAKGREVSVPMFIRNPPAEGFKLTKPPEVTPSDLKVEIIPDDRGQGKALRCVLKVSYPASGPRVDHQSLNPGRIHLSTNHPGAPEIDLIVYLSSR
ncbi:MAG: DUF1573 domain-containing protein [Planctomycetes bacterium]|nr:DUF1573 domain-containing protein [Planctomycetota bacterium]